jgi:hypothetical protein
MINKIIDLFHFLRAAFSTTLQVKVGSTLAKSAPLRIHVNIDGTPITSKTHTHPVLSLPLVFLIHNKLSVGLDFSIHNKHLQIDVFETRPTTTSVRLMYLSVFDSST